MSRRSTLRTVAARSLRQLAGRPSANPAASPWRTDLAGATVHPQASIAPGARLTPTTTVGRWTRLNGPIVVKSRDEVRIEPFCSIGMQVELIGFDHHLQYPSHNVVLHEAMGFVDLVRRRGVMAIGPDALVGDKSTIIAPATIGAGAVVGAGSVVTRDVPPFTVVAGNPARVVLQRFDDDMVAALLEVAWWDWDDERIRRNATFFGTDLTRLDPAAMRELVVP